MRRVEMLYNKAVELNKEYEQKVKELDIEKWPTQDIIFCIQASLECSDDFSIASRAFWNSDAIERELRKEDKKKLFNKAKDIDEDIIRYKRKVNKGYTISDVSEYHFDYKRVCKELDHITNVMIKEYESYLNYENLSGDLEAYYAFKDIQTVYSEYKNCIKDRNDIRKSKLYKDVQNLKEKEYTGNSDIDKILDTLYNYDFTDLNSGWVTGRGISDHVIDIIRNAVYNELDKIEPDMHIAYYYPVEFDSEEEQHKFFTIINHVIDTFSSKQKDTRESNIEFRLKYGSLIKLILNKINNLKEAKNKISNDVYKNEYCKLRKYIKII